MKLPQDHTDVARALSSALEPLIDVCLKIGITSPEIESLLRVAFVQRAFEKLPRHARTGRGPSDRRVGLAAGVHRIEVGKIRTAGGTVSAKSTMEKKERLYSKSARVLTGWTTDTRFMTSGGLPLDLPMERNKQRRSFEDLVDKYAPGNHPGSVLKELRRRKNVEMLDDKIIRYKSTTPRARALTKATVAQPASRIKRLGDTLFQNILDTAHPRLYAETKTISLDAEQIALIRGIIDRRAKTFLTSVEGELSTRSTKGTIGAKKRMGLGVFSWEED